MHYEASHGSPVPISVKPSIERQATLRETNSRLLILQIRAFFNAAEDVPMDAETVEDLLNSIPEDRLVEFARTSRQQDHDRDAEAEDGSTVLLESDELDISALFYSTEQGEYNM